MKLRIGILVISVALPGSTALLMNDNEDDWLGVRGFCFVRLVSDEINSVILFYKLTISH